MVGAEYIHFLDDGNIGTMCWDCKHRLDRIESTIYGFSKATLRMNALTDQEKKDFTREVRRRIGKYEAITL